MKDNSTPPKKSVATGDIAAVYVKKGVQKLLERAYKQSIENFEKAMKIYEKNKEWKPYLDAYQEKIFIYFQLGWFDKSISILEDYLSKAKEYIQDPTPMKLFYYIGLGDIYQRQSNFLKASELYESAIFILKQSPEPHYMYQIRVHAGMGWNRLYIRINIQKAIHHFNKALSIPLPEILKHYLSGIYQGVGIYYMIQGQLDEAINNYKKGIHADIQLNTIPTDSNVHLNLADAYSRRGDYGEAIQYGYKALEVAKINKQGNRDLTANVYRLLAMQYIKQNKINKGLEYCDKAMSIFLELFGEQHLNISKISHQVAEALKSQKEYENALHYLQKALKIEKNLLDVENLKIGFSYQEIGNCLFHQGKTEEAYNYYQKSIQLLKKHPSTFQNKIGLSYRYMAEYFFVKKGYHSALQHVQKSILSVINDFNDEDPYSFPQKIDYHDFLTMFYGFQLKARIFYEKYHFQSKHLKDLLAAYKSYQYLQKIINLQRKAYRTEKSHFILNQRVLPAYSSNIKICKELHLETQQNHYLTECFTISEQQKNHLLRTAIKDVEAKTKAKIPKELLEEEKQFRKQITQLKDTIIKVQVETTDSDNEEILQLKAQQFDIEAEYQQLIQHFEKEYPEYYQIKHSTHITNVAEVQAYLKGKNSESSPLVTSSADWMISYFVGEKHLYIFILTPTDYQVIEIAKPSNFEQLIQDFNTAINSVEIEDFMEAATQLYELLIVPLQLQKNTQSLQSLTILRHDTLHYLSFDALFFPPMENETEILDFHELDYLIYHFDISYHYSATLLLHSKKRSQTTQQKPTTFLGLAPVSFDQDAQYTEVEMESFHGETKVLRGKQFDATTLENLPNTAIEVNEVYQLFHEQKLSAKAYLYGAASKENLFEEAPKHKYVLIATHGFNFNSEGNLSGIYLAKNQGEIMEEQQVESKSHELGSAEDTPKKSELKRNSEQPKTNQSEEPQHALLTTTEAYHLQLEADLVVLSSCSSGIGTLQKGEGMMALHRGFLYAGASNIIFTQFNIPDEMSSILVKKLFSSILEGDTYATAMRKAKLHILQQKGVSPQDWAAFALIGA